jgi:hypothetical protein
MEIRPAERPQYPTRKELQEVADEVLLNRPDSVSIGARSVGTTAAVLGAVGTAAGAIFGENAGFACLLPGLLGGVWAANRNGSPGMQAEAMTVGFTACTCAGAAVLASKHGWQVGLGVAAGGALITGLMFMVLADNRHQRVDQMLKDFEQKVDNVLEPLKIADATTQGSGGAVQEQNGAVNVGGVLVRGKKR